MNFSIKSILQPIKPLVIKTTGLYYTHAQKKLLERSLTIFLFHDVSEHPSEFSQNYHLNVKPDLFKYQLKFIKDHFEIITPDDLLESRIPPRAALITFDDGLHTFFINVIPILNECQVPCLICLNMAPILKKELFWSGVITYLCDKCPDFIQYLTNRLNLPRINHPLFLYCTEDIVNSYLEVKNQNIDLEVMEFVGKFASEEDLQTVEKNKYVFLGSHLFNHYVPLLLSRERLIQAYQDNVNALSSYSNYRNIVSFPFGQPGTCFSDNQVDLLLNAGAQKVFCSSSKVNYSPSDNFLDRVVLTDIDDSPSKIWFQIFKHRLRK